MRAVETGLGPMELYHVGVAVRDIEDGMRRFGDLLGISRWGRLDAAIPSRYRGEHVKAGMRAAYGDTGSTYIELVQPTEGRWTAQTFLDERGEGIYHLGYWVDDVPEALRRAHAMGIGVDWISEADGKPIAVYLEAAATSGVHVELVATSIRPFLQAQFT